MSSVEENKYYSVTYSNSLSHHGIKGQRWGKRNGPPYPLDAGDHSVSEKKAGWRRSLRGRRRKGYLGNYGYSDDEITNARKKYTKESRNRNKVESTSSMGQTKGYWKNAPKQTIAQRMYDDERSEYKKEFGFKLTDKQKKYLKIGAAVAVTGLAIYGAYKLGGTGAIQDFVNNSSLANTIVHRMNSDTIPEFTKGFTTEEDIRKLTDPELKALQIYTVPGFYKQINGCADALFDKNTSPEWFNGQNKDILNVTRSIDNAIQKTVLRKDANLQRGIDESTCRKLLGEEMFGQIEKLRDSARNSGETVKGISVEGLNKKRLFPRGYTSTAIPLEYANGRRSSVADGFSGKNGIVFEVHAKKGLHAINIQSISELNAEREILFARNSIMKPTGMVDIIDGVVHVYVEMIQK